MKDIPTTTDLPGSVRALDQIEIKTIYDAFSQAFASYFVPIEISLTQFIQRMGNQGVDYAGSYGYFEENELQCFILHAFKTEDGQRFAYNAGTGTIPASRGRNLTRHIYGHCIELLRERGVAEVRLEVITENHAAIRAYEGVGFTAVRELLYAKDSNADVQHPSDREPDLHIAPMKAPDWDQLRQFWDWEPTWQNGVDVLQADPEHYVILGARRDDRLLGYLAVAPSSGKVAQCAVNPAYRRQGVATALVWAARNRCEEPLAFVNVDAGDVASAGLLSAMGLSVKLRQFEMRLRLTSP